MAISRGCELEKGKEMRKEEGERSKKKIRRHQDVSVTQRNGTDTARAQEDDVNFEMYDELP